MKRKRFTALAWILAVALVASLFSSSVVFAEDIEVEVNTEEDKSSTATIVETRQEQVEIKSGILIMDMV